MVYHARPHLTPPTSHLAARRIEVATRDGLRLGGWHLLPSSEAARACLAASGTMGRTSEEEAARSGGSARTGNGAAMAKSHARRVVEAESRSRMPECCAQSLRRAKKVILFLHGQAGHRGGVFGAKAKLSGACEPRKHRRRRRRRHPTTTTAAVRPRTFQHA